MAKKHYSKGIRKNRKGGQLGNGKVGGERMRRKGKWRIGKKRK